MCSSESSKHKTLSYLNAAVRAFQDIAEHSLCNSWQHETHVRNLFQEKLNYLENESRFSSRRVERKQYSFVTVSCKQKDGRTLNDTKNTSSVLCDDAKLSQVNDGSGLSEAKCNGGTRPTVANSAHVLTLEEQFYVTQCFVVSDSHEVRTAGFRLIRYMLQNASDIEVMCKANIIPFIVRALDLCSGTNDKEGLQALHLVRKMLQVASNASNTLFPESIIRSVIALADGGQQKRDVFLYSNLAIVTELVVNMPAQSLCCGAISAIQGNLLRSGNVPRIHEALLGSLLQLANTSKYRSHTEYLLQLIAAFTDNHYGHPSMGFKAALYNEDKELQLSTSHLSMLVLLKTWPGLILLSRDDYAALRCITSQLMYSPHIITLASIIDLLYDVFVVRKSWKGKEDCSDLKSLVNEVTATGLPRKECDLWVEMVTSHTTTSVDSGSWSLFDGFLTSDEIALLPHLARSRPNLVRNHLALLLYAFMQAGVIEALCHTVIHTSTLLAIRSTILLGELVHRAQQDLPVECCEPMYALPQLISQAAGCSTASGGSEEEFPLTFLAQHSTSTDDSGIGSVDDTTAAGKYRTNDNCSLDLLAAYLK